MNFSVLLSLYIKEKPDALSDSLQSIWYDQEYKPSEIVLVLDGPITVELNNIVQWWKQQLNHVLKIVPLKNNIGLARALNEGLNHCSYDWVFRMDTDDVCTSDRFKKQIEFIRQNPDIVLFGGQIKEFNNVINDSTVIKSVPCLHEDIKKFAERRCPFNHMTVAYRKKIILELGAYQHHMYMEDYNLWLRVIGAGYQVANLKDVILNARVGNGMHARRKGLEYIKSEKQLLKLKKELKLQSPIHANILFLIRSVFRLIPSSLLGKIYNTFLRKKVRN